jgi:hypothetical protein
MFKSSFRLLALVKIAPSHPGLECYRSAMKILVILLVIVVTALANAQTLAEMQFVTATAAQLNPAISLPRGSMQAVGDASAIIAKVPGHQNYSDWEVYTATGIVANLQPAFISQVSSSFAGAGYFLNDQSEKTVGAATHTKYVFADDAGIEALLYVIRDGQELIWLIAKGN